MADTNYAGTQFVVSGLVVEVYPYGSNSITLYKNIVTSARTKYGQYDNLLNSRITAFGSLFEITGRFRGWADELDERTEEELKSDGCVLIHPDSESGYPKMYCGETDDFGIVPGNTCFGAKVFDVPGNSVSARVHTFDTSCSSETHYITPIITGDSDAADEYHTLGIAFAVVHPDGDIVEVLSSDELGAFTLRPFDNDFWNGLAHGLRGVGTPVFKPSTSFERGYVAGADLRNHRDEVSADNLSKTKFSYNGTKLPALPAWDSKAYPYAFIFRVKVITTYIYYLALTDSLVYGTSDLDSRGVLVRPNDPAYRGYSYATTFDPIVYTNENEFVDLADVVWSNKDITAEDGTLYLASSNPIPVL